MQHIKVQSPAFIQPKGLSVSNKDAMENVNDIVVNKVVEVVDKVVEVVDSKVEEVTDKALDVAEDGLQKAVEVVGDTVVKPIADLLDNISDNPIVQGVVDRITDSIAEQVDGRVFSCFCLGWGLSLKISRKRPQPTQSKDEVLDSTLPELPPPREVVKELPPPTVLPVSQ